MTDDPLPHFDTRKEAWDWIEQEYAPHVFDDVEWVEDMIEALTEGTKS